MELYLRVALGIIAIYAICYLSYILVKALILYRRSLHTQQRLTTNGAGKTTPAACIHHWAINSDGLPYCIKCKRMRGAPLS